MFGQRMNPFSSLDELNRALFITGFGAMLLKLLFRARSLPRFLLTLLSVACLLYAVIRIFGGNPARRNQENLRYLTVATAVRDFWMRVRDWFRRVADRFRSGKGTSGKHTNSSSFETKTYTYFHCPQCTQRMRAPKGKGHLRVTCHNCGKQFEIDS